LDGLAYLGVALRTTTTNWKLRRSLLHRASRIIQGLKLLAQYNPNNCLSYAVLLEAEYAAVTKRYDVAGINYDRAISISTKGSLYDLSIHYQVAGNFYLSDMHDVEKGLKYLRAACQVYEEWGCLAAVTHLRERIRELESIDEL